MLTTLEVHVLAEHVSALERHLARVESKLPTTPAALWPATDTSDAVVLHQLQVQRFAGFPGASE